MLVLSPHIMYRHTGVVVYGNEYFFGGMGIEYCPPVSCFGASLGAVSF